MKPFATYNGGKAGHGTYQKIINNIPKHSIYIEPMVGNGGILFNLNLPGMVVINDIDSAVIDKYDYKCLGYINRSVKVHNQCYSEIIEKYDDFENVFFYFDPPYLKSTRKNEKDLYRFEWEESQHILFLEKIKKIKNKVMVSHYPCTLYDTELQSWNSLEFYSTTRKGKALDKIYMNYPTPKNLQDYRYLGINSIDRQRIKRKSERTLEKFKNLPIHERNLILGYLADKYIYTAE